MSSRILVPYERTMADLPEGWLPHDGGPCPVAPSILCRVIVLTPGGPLRHAYTRPAAEWHWEIDPKLTGAIIAYKPEGA